MQNSPRRHRDTSRDWKRNAQRPCAPSRPRPRTFPSRFVALRKTEIFGCPRAAFAYLRGRRGPCAWASWFRSWLLMCGVCLLLYVPPKKCYCRSGFFANVLNKKVRGLKGRPFAMRVVPAASVLAVAAAALLLVVSYQVVLHASCNLGAPSLPACHSGGTRPATGSLSVLALRACCCFPAAGIWQVGALERAAGLLPAAEAPAVQSGPRHKF